MRGFDYFNVGNELLTADIVNMVSAIHEQKGQQKLFIEQKADALENLLETARIQSTESSNRIEGVFTSDKRMAAIMREKAEPHNRNESEIAGYRDVLAVIHASYDYIPVRAGTILQLHRDLYKYSPSGMGGSFKNSDNFIEERDSAGKVSIRFKPVGAFETPDYIERLCGEFNRAVDGTETDPLLLIPVFILDFLCNHIDSLVSPADNKHAFPF